MRNNQTLDAMLGTLGTQDSFKVPDDFMTGVWQRAGQLGEIVERRRRMALSPTAWAARPREAARSRTTSPGIGIRVTSPVPSCLPRAPVAWT